MEFYFTNGLAESTRKAYGSGKKRYFDFCKAKQVIPIPTSEAVLCQFIAQLANEKLAHTTIKTYLAAVRHAQIEWGRGDPKIANMARLEQVLRGIKAVQCKARPASDRARLPITPDLLSKMKQSWEEGRGHIWDRKMLWAASLLCFFGFFRSGEITVPSQTTFDQGAHLSFEDVAVDSWETPRLLRVRLKASKTDPFRTGVDVFIGATGSSLCPVAAVLAYMSMRGPGPGPLFRLQNGSPLTRTRLVSEVRNALSAAGVDCRAYSGHSFRSGAATTAAKEGVEDSTIKMLGRWKSEAYQVYIKTPREQLAAISKVLAGVR